MKVLVKQKCPIKGCKCAAYAEVDLSKVSSDKYESLKRGARKRLKIILEKHHKDGHPKEIK